MNKSDSTIIENALFAAAAAMLPGERGALSPLEQFGGERLTKKAVQTLKKHGLITPSGNIKPEFQACLQELMDPIHLFNLDWLGREKEGSLSVFFRELKSQPISLFAAGDFLDISIGSAFTKIKSEINQCLSIKRGAKSNFTMDIPLEHAWTLAAALDLSREKQPDAKTPGGVSAEEINKALEDFRDSPAWLWLNTLSIQSENEPRGSLDIEGSLAWLVKHGWATKKSGRFLPAGEAGEIAKQVIQPAAVLNLISAEKVNAIYIETQKLIFFEGKNALIGWAYRPDEGSIHFLKRSLEDLLKVLETCAQAPQMLFAVLDLNIEEILNVPCPACGQLQDPTSKFCKDCGAAFMTGEKLEIIPEPAVEEKPQNAKDALRGRLSQKAAADQDQAVEQKQPVKRKIRWWMILLIILGVMLLGCLLVSLFVPITIRF